MLQGGPPDSIKGLVERVLKDGRLLTPHPLQAPLHRLRRVALSDILLEIAVVTLGVTVPLSLAQAAVTLDVSRWWICGLILGFLAFTICVSHPDNPFRRPWGVALAIGLRLFLVLAIAWTAAFLLP